MVHPASNAPPRRIVLRANRETLVLVLTACAATFTLSYAIHARPPETPVAESVEAQAPRQDWAGHLADMATDSTPTASIQPMTSASLVVPKSALALPNLMVRKPHLCDQTSCTVKNPVPARAKLNHFEELEREARQDHGLLGKLNPLNHLPSLSTLGKPFAVAGNTISGWIDRF